MVTEMVVDKDFTGLKQFSTNLGYPDNDGFKWQQFQRKRKGSTRYKCIDCDAEKIKYKTKTQLKQTRFTVRNNPITVKYKVSHSCDSQAGIKNILKRTFHNRKKKSTKNTANGIGTDILGEKIHESENVETFMNDGDDNNAQKDKEIQSIESVVISESASPKDVGTEILGESINSEHNETNTFDCDDRYTQKDAKIQSLSPQCDPVMNSKEADSQAFYKNVEDIDLANWLEDDWDVNDADFDDEICNIDDILSKSIPLENQQSDNHFINFDKENSEENTDYQINDGEINDEEKDSNNDVPKLIEKGRSTEAERKKTISRKEVCIEDEETKDETKDEIKIVTVKTIDDVDEQINQSTAYIIPNTTTKPKINRKTYEWGPNQPGRKGLTSYKCAGKSGTKVQCKASKYMFHCIGTCTRKIWDNQCCKTAEEKLVILYLGAHTCEMKSNYCEVNNEDDMFTNLKVLNKNEKHKYEVIKVKKLPCDISGNKLYLIAKESDENIEHLIKDGRRYQKSFKTKNSAFNKVFGKKMENQVRLFKCRGTNYCFNKDCPFLRRFEAINQVQFDLKDGEKSCVSCGEVMHSMNCDARKYVVHDEKYIVVKHEGQHECPPRTTYETDIVMEIEKYFSLNGLSTPFEAVVNHLNKMLDLENAEQEIKDLVNFSLKNWTIKNAKRRVIKRQNPYGPTLQV